MRFEEDNSETIRLGKLVAEYLYGYEEVSMLILPNICSLWTNYTQRPNSNLLVEDMGGGKSTFFEIIYESNKRYITRLPSKIYASDLVKSFKKSCFKNKLLMHDDLIPAFSGLSNKSREQLTGFFTELLSSGKYIQLGNKVTGNCNALFGIARKFFYERQTKIDLLESNESEESLGHSNPGSHPIEVKTEGNKEKPNLKEKLFTETFTDRVIQIKPISKDITAKLKVLEFMCDRKTTIPKIVLPLGVKKNIIFNPKNLDMKRFNNLCLDFDRLHIISVQRAFNYCINFMKGNALLNNRTEINNNDLELLQDLLPLHFAQETNYSKTYKVLSRFPDLTDDQLIQKSNLSKGTFYKYKNIIGGKERFMPTNQ